MNQYENWFENSIVLIFFFFFHLTFYYFFDFQPVRVSNRNNTDSSTTVITAARFISVIFVDEFSESLNNTPNVVTLWKTKLLLLHAMKNKKTVILGRFPRKNGKINPENQTFYTNVNAYIILLLLHRFRNNCVVL